MIQLTLILTPHSALALTRADDGGVLDAGRSERLQRAFGRGSGHGLLSLGLDDAGAILPPVFSWWRDFGARFVAALCASQGRDENGAAVRLPAHDHAELARLANTPPIMTGAEYLSDEVLGSLWRCMGQAFTTSLLKPTAPCRHS